MTYHYKVLWEPTPDEIEAIAVRAPHSAFNTVDYAAACRSVGRKPCAFLLLRDAELAGGCLGFLQTGLLSSRVEIVSAPNVDDHAFWREVCAACRSKGVSELSIQTFGSQPLAIPHLPGEMSRRPRVEYVIDLDAPDALQRMSTNCRRNINRARRAGLAVRRTREPNAAEAHLDAMASSMRRRRDRGEDAADPENLRFIAALLGAGAAEIFQVVDGATVLSSVLVIRSNASAYYHSAGTFPQGMSNGAAALLISEVATILRHERIHTFNLGGADEGADGLRRFKSGFGAREVVLEAAVVSLASPLKRRAVSALRLLRARPSLFVAAVAGKFAKLEHYAVFRGSPGEISARIERTDGALQPIVEPELARLSQTIDYKDHPARARSIGYNAAYGLYVDGALVHVAWLIDSEMDRMNPIRNVRLRPGEVEITHCVTGASFRGHGFYPLAIRRLCAVAHANGAHTVFMITGSDNRASRSGIEKAGLSGCACILRLIFPWTPHGTSLTWRGHRFKGSRSRALERPGPQGLDSGAR